MYPSLRREPPYLCALMSCLAELKEGCPVVILDDGDELRFIFCSECCMNTFLAGGEEGGNDDGCDIASQ
jgi:hypothetical protein